VIGINTAIASSSGGNEGIGFSIPINMVMVIARQLIEHGAVARAYLGVTLDREFTPAIAQQIGLARAEGARVTGLTPGSPAERVGIRVGDVILRYDGVRVEDDAHLINLVSLTEVGRDVVLEVFRDNETLELTVRVGDRNVFESRSWVAPPDDPTGDLGAIEVDAWEFAELGLTLTPLDDALAAELRLPRGVTGLVVTEVDEFGPAAGRIDRGEIIDRIDEQAVTAVEHLERLLAEAHPDTGPLALHVLPGTSGRHLPRTVVLRPGGPALR
jgi:serine protease Do